MENDINKKTTSQKINEVFDKMSDDEKNKLLKKFNTETILLSLLSLFVLPIMVFLISTNYIENIYQNITIFVIVIVLSFVGCFIYTIRFIKSRKLFAKISKNSKIKFIIKQYELYSDNEPLNKYKNRYYCSDKESRGGVYVGIGCLLFIAGAGIYAATVVEAIGGKIGAIIFSLSLIVLSIILWFKCLKKPKQKD